jgi:PAS domain S-box-containing protein
MNVLILDDIPRNRKLLRAQLEAEGMEVSEASNGAEGLAELKRTKFDAAISDLLMPNMDGYRFCYEVRKSARFRNLPLVIYTATYTSPSDEKLSFELGADKYLRKPASPDAIVAALQEAAMIKSRPALKKPTELDVLKEYSERLVSKLEEKNIELKASQEQSRLQSTALATTCNAVLITDHMGKIVWINRAFTELTGYTETEALGRTPRILKSGKHDAAFYRAFWKTILAGKTWQGEFTNKRKDGSLFLDEHTVTPILSPDGTITHFISVMHDITARKETEQHLHSTNAKLREQADIIERAHDAVIIRDFETDLVQFWNRGAEHLYGWTSAEAVGRPLGELIFAKSDKREKLIEQLLAAGDFHGEVEHKTKDGREVVAEARATLIRNDDGSPRSILGINSDMTDQKKLQAQFLRAQRLESIGTLASGVAHDLNNILAPILMGSAMLAGSNLSSSDRKILAAMETSAQRGADVVKQVLTFARGAEGARLCLQPAHLIKDVRAIADETFPKEIRVRASLPKSLWSVDGDPTNLHQVLLNLCVNARDAMPAGGILTLTAENVTIDEHYASMTPGAKAGPHVLVQVIDTGMGIARDVLDKIFDPFFTTKEVGHGTGLGLSTVIGIVKSHKGFVEVESEVGKGTTFKIYLPARIGECGDNVETAAKEASPRAKGELLLLVDDEKSILLVAQALLEHHGYQVLAAADATEALAIFAMRQNEIDLVLTDIAMPFMDGVALIRTLRKMKPDVKVIASSGRGGKGEHADEFAALNVRACLTKPYNKEKLLTTLHDVLSSNGAEP